MANDVAISGAAKTDAPNHGKDVIERLQGGKLPQMVDWFDPGLLAKVGVRSVISATLGSYTDQRLMQAATDNADENTLFERYDYSETAPPGDRISPNESGAVWVDYIADLGDGFEPTYAMAYLLASDTLKVRGEAIPLPAGQLLIMGGDQVYPDATNQEYQDRLRDPYDWAFRTPTPTRKLFAIPGNHDWYDGLSAFSALFCSARDRISEGTGAQIGGWRCHQHRSYFAIKLPHDWWIWGPDIQLADNLDDSQRDYFYLKALQTKPGDKIILCLAEPSWLHKNYDNMHEISMLARTNGATICAVLAGDWHHYSRYTSDQLGTEFITAGGGGAFAHATHGLKKKIKLSWASRVGGHRKEDAGDTPAFNRLERAVIGRGGPNFSQQLAAGQSSETPTAVVEPKPSADIEPTTSRRAKTIRKEEIKSAAYDFHATAIYPPQWKSRLLCLKNLTLPFRNKRFAVLVGIVYFLFAWTWAASDPRQSPIMQKLAADIYAQAKPAQNVYLAAEAEYARLTKQQGQFPPDQLQTQAGIALAERLAQAKINRDESLKIFQEIEERSKSIDGGREIKLKLALEEYATITKQPDKSSWSFKDKFAWFKDIFESYNSLSHVLDPAAFFAAVEQSPFFAFLLMGLWIGLVGYVELPSTLAGNIGKLAAGTIHFAAHIIALLFISWLVTGFSVPFTKLMHLEWPEVIWPDILRVVWNFSVTMLLGGLIGGFVMGLYWTLTSTLFNMHTGDAFGALGIKNYKNFLRIKLEKDRATIYPIALDKVPGPSGWRWELKSGEVRPSHNPLILPAKPLEPRLIEAPIMIQANKVKP